MKFINEKSAILSILFTNNNIICTLTDLTGNVLFWTSLGVRKIRGIKKLTSNTIISRIKLINIYANKAKLKYFHLYIKGVNKNKKLVIKNLKYSSLIFLSIYDESVISYNGCKKLRNRRI
uniref:Ribosomal protein S11 n=1 Tax=Rhodogorgon sp. TaxID=2485824 RepID=A0A3G3MIM5_9FLOR|nr:ribosomal protein S11 [Rhodogorgon sp.]